MGYVIEPGIWHSQDYHHQHCSGVLCDGVIDNSMDSYQVVLVYRITCIHITLWFLMLAELHRLVEGRINLMLIDGLLRGIEEMKGLRR